MTNADRPPGTILLADGSVSSLDAYLEGGRCSLRTSFVPRRKPRSSAASTRPSAEKGFQEIGSGPGCPSGSRASAQGDVASTRRPSGATMRSIRWRTASSPSNRPSSTPLDPPTTALIRTPSAEEPEPLAAGVVIFRWAASRHRGLAAPHPVCRHRRHRQTCRTPGSCGHEQIASASSTKTWWGTPASQPRLLPQLGRQPVPRSLLERLRPAEPACPTCGPMGLSRGFAHGDSGEQAEGCP